MKLTILQYFVLKLHLKVVATKIYNDLLFLLQEFKTSDISIIVHLTINSLTILYY